MHVYLLYSHCLLTWRFLFLAGIPSMTRPEWFCTCERAHPSRQRPVRWPIHLVCCSFRPSRCWTSGPVGWLQQRLQVPPQCRCVVLLLLLLLLLLPCSVFYRF